MNPPSKDIAEYLETSAAGIGLTLATDLFYSFMPTRPDQCTSVHDIGGGEPCPAVDELYYPEIQVICRANTYDAAYSNAYNVLTALHRLDNVIINSTRYSSIWAQSDIINVGDDEENRPRVSVHFRIHRTNS